VIDQEVIDQYVNVEVSRRRSAAIAARALVAVCAWVTPALVSVAASATSPMVALM
jgi:hypothetical protein